MKISFNPSNSNKNILDLIKNNKDIIFDLKGHSIFARGVEFKGTDTNTWRPVVDNLTSDSTTSSLSAKQGKVLKALIDGKSNSDHNHDGRYLRLSGQDTMQGNLYLHSHGTSYIGKGLGDKSGADFTEANIVIRSWWGISFKSHDDIVRTYIDTRTGNIGTKGVLNAVGAVIQGRVYNGGDDEGIIINPAPNGYAGLILGTHNGERSVFYFKKGNPFWRYNNGSTNLDIYHPKKSGTIALTSDIPNKDSWNYDDRYLRLTGGWMSGDINFGGDNKICWERNTDSASISFKNDGDANSYMSFVTSDNGNEYFRWSHISGSTNTEWMALRSDGLRVRGTKVSLEGHTHDDRYYTESEVNSLLDAKLNRQNLSCGYWNPRGYHLAADYNYNGGDLSISESGGKIHVSVDGYFWQNEGQYRVLDTSDVAELKSNLTVHQYLSATDAAWYPLVWGGNAHKNISDSTGAVYKSYDKLSWQTSSQTLYATNIQTNNIKNLSIGGGIYWNPYVESATDGSDAASITLVRSGVAGGTTLVLSWQNDTNDTIQFKTNTAARLYHNSYPILTTQNTYVSNNKGYINGTEITQVNNSDTLDGAHLSDIKNWSDRTASAYWKAGWYKVASAQTATNIEAFLTLDVNAANSEGHATLFIRKRADSKPYFICTHNNNLNLADFRLYYNGMSMVLYARVPNDWNGRVFRIISEGREGTYDHIWTLYSNMSSTDPNAISAEGGNPYINPTYSGRVDWSNSSDKANYANSAGSVAWNNVTDKPSAFNPAAHTHTVFKNNLMIKGTNGVSDSASIHLGIGDSDTGFKWISDGVCQIYANNVAVGQWTSGGMNWFKNPTVNGNKVWNAGNDGSGSGLDADTLDGEHASSFVRAGHYESQDLNKLDTYSFIRSVNSNVSSTSPKGNTGWYNVIQLVHRNGASDGPSYIGQIALGMTTNTNDMFFRGKRTDPWKTVIHSGNIGNQTVANAYHLRINSTNTWSTWYWAGQSDQPSWLWGSNDGTNMYVWNPSNFNVNTAQYLRSLGNQNCQTGRTQAYGDVYSYNTYNGNTGSPTTYSSVIGFGRGSAGTVEIAGGWCNTHLYWRSLRDCGEDWFHWRTVLDSGNYTEFINNYYWANVKISASSSTTTSPTVLNLTATNSIRMGNISLEHTDEINNSANNSLHLNLRNSGNVSLCVGGGKVGIGTMSPSQELYVQGYTHTKGFGIGIQYLSESGSLPTISPGDGYTYRCLEIGIPTKVSCIIADKVPLSGVRGILLKFMQGFEGQIVLLKDLENYGSGNGHFWVMPSGCRIIHADTSKIRIDQNQISNTYDDGRSRFFIYSPKYRAWIEFMCS